MFALAWTVERVVLRPLVNQPDIILFMATIGLNSFLIGFGETIFGGEPKTMITSELGLPTGSTAIEMLGGQVIFQHLDIAAAVIAGLMVAALAIFFNVSKIGRALCALSQTITRPLSRSASRCSKSGSSSGLPPASWPSSRASCGARVRTFHSRLRFSRLKHFRC